MPDTPAASRFFACFIPCIWFNASPVLLVLLLLAIIGLGKITRFAAGGLMFPSQIGGVLNAQKNRDLSLVIMSNVCDGQKITTDEALFSFFRSNHTNRKSVVLFGVFLFVPFYLFILMFISSFLFVFVSVGRIGFDSTQSGGDVGPTSGKEMANLLQQEEGKII